MLKAITVHTIHLNKIHASVTSYQTERERGGGYGAQHFCRGQLKCDGTCVETRFRLSAKQTSPFKTTRGGASVQSTTGSQGVHISGSNAGYAMFRGSVKGTGYPLHLPVSPSLPLPCVTVCHHISTGVYTTEILVAQFYLHSPICLPWHDS